MAGNYLRGRFASAAFTCALPPIVRAAEGGTQPRAFMDLHAFMVNLPFPASVSLRLL